MFLHAFALSAGLGFLIGIAGLMAAGAEAGSAAFITAVSAGPAIVGASLGAALLARLGARAQPPWQQRDWARRGAGLGAFGGAGLLSLWFVVLNVAPAAPPWPVVGFMLVAGAVAGGIVGLLVGLYCARFVRHRLAA